MKVTIEPATPAEIDEIDGFRYEPPYDFYDGADDPVENPERFFVARDEQGALVGFFYFDSKEGVLEIGLGLREEWTGRGDGLDFTRAGIAFGRTRFRPTRIVLKVAAFNARAITVYERAGFAATGEHVRTFARWGEVPFVEMEEER